MAALGKSEMVLLIGMAFVGVCFGDHVYKVGESDGWSIKNHFNFQRWVKDKTFYVNDTFVFEYVYPNDDVMEVSRGDYRSCTKTAPLNIYESGLDSIRMWSPGHFYYISTKSDHCEKGQKVAIKVFPACPSSTPAPPPQHSSPSSPPPVTANPPSPSSTPAPQRSSPSSPPPVAANTPSPSSNPTPPNPSSQAPSPLAEAPHGSHNSAASFISSKGLLAIQFFMSLGFLAYY